MAMVKYTTAVSNDWKERLHRLRGFALLDAQHNCSNRFATDTDIRDSEIFTRIGTPKRNGPQCQWCKLYKRSTPSCASMQFQSDLDTSCARCDMALCGDCWEVCSGCGAFLCDWCVNYHRCGRYRAVGTDPKEFPQSAG